MSQKPSGYERKPHDLYETPAWVTLALCDALADRVLGTVWEPAAGSGKMVAALRARAPAGVVETDLQPRPGKRSIDFLAAGMPLPDIRSIITNPPYGPRGVLATAFIRHALMLTKGSQGLVAMLLRADFDSAKSRRDVFGDCPAFAHKLILRKRINWFEAGKHGSTENHCWFVWDWMHDGPPTIGYAP
jgi:hypothetical protein